ncbi:Mg2+ transporter zinc transport [Fusarium tjaetaba]|uniref:Mg2+ transporter zinc transport n=1 Tax=Fusarium tjaetaba TaxID=1567544 RepID=A0A8H5RFI9_9HYPO|nr:Mg2+ transporter zinc transport [Fusarium tjaetaba]KAF5632277.1 Mg2+ transporter zinc transport [Fusarium tjaetaba]
MSRVSSSHRPSQASSYLRRSTSENDGSWLSAPGPYRDLIRSLCASRPDLRSRDETNESEWPPTCYKPRIVALEMQGDSVHERLETSDPRELDQHFREYKAKESPKKRMIYLLEGLNPEFISILGGHLMIHPSLFTDHLWWKSLSSTGHNIDNIALASSAQDYICFEYPEDFWFNEDDDNSYRSNCLKTGRLTVRNDLAGDYVSLTVDRKCSFWSSMLYLNLEEPSAPAFFIEKIVLQHFLRQHDVLKINILDVQHEMVDSDLERLTPADLEIQRHNGHCGEIHLIDNCDKLSRVIGRLSLLNPRIVNNAGWGNIKPAANVDGTC